MKSFIVIFLCAFASFDLFAGEREISLLSLRQQSSLGAGLVIDYPPTNSIAQQISARKLLQYDDETGAKFFLNPNETNFRKLLVGKKAELASEWLFNIAIPNWRLVPLSDYHSLRQAERFRLASAFYAGLSTADQGYVAELALRHAFFSFFNQEFDRFSMVELTGFANQFIEIAARGPSHELASLFCEQNRSWLSQNQPDAPRASRRRDFYGSLLRGPYGSIFEKLDCDTFGLKKAK